MGDDDGAISVQKDWRNSGVEIANCRARTPSEAQPWSPILDVRMVCGAKRSWADKEQKAETIGQRTS
jgi:hypothetical protein